MGADMRPVMASWSLRCSWVCGHGGSELHLGSWGIMSIWAGGPRPWKGFRGDCQSPGVQHGLSWGEWWGGGGRVKQRWEGGEER